MSAERLSRSLKPTREQSFTRQRGTGTNTPGSPMQVEVLRLQRAAGNRAVNGLIATDRFTPTGKVFVSRKGGDKKAKDNNVPTDIKKRVEEVVGKSGFKLTDLQAALFMAGEGERAAVAADTTIMSKVKAGLTPTEWVKAMAELHVYAPAGIVAHASAKDADKQIRTKYNEYLGKALKAGKQVRNQFMVLSGQDWFDAYYHEFPNEAPQGGPTDEEPNTNAFTTTKEPKDIIVLNKDKGNPGTTIHEGLHLYQDNAVLNKLGVPFNEGVTELLTRKVTDPMGIARTNYSGHHDAMVAVEAVVGETVLMKAYFNGKIDEVKKKFIAFRVTKGDKKSTASVAWDTLVSHFRKKEFDKAEDLCK